jgi:hypothetical protein
VKIICKKYTENILLTIKTNTFTIKIALKPQKNAKKFARSIFFANFATEVWLNGL